MRGWVFPGECGVDPIEGIGAVAGFFDEEGSGDEAEGIDGDGSGADGDIFSVKIGKDRRRFFSTDYDARGGFFGRGLWRLGRGGFCGVGAGGRDVRGFVCLAAGRCVGHRVGGFAEAVENGLDGIRRGTM